MPERVLTLPGIFCNINFAEFAVAAEKNGATFHVEMERGMGKTQMRVALASSPQNAELGPETRTSLLQVVGDLLDRECLSSL